MDASLYTHHRVEDPASPDGIYRVVGATDERLTLVRVGDDDGRRIHTGEVIHLTGDQVDGLSAAENPDGTRPPVERAWRTLEMAHWSGRAFIQAVVANPRSATAAGIVLLVGLVGGAVGPEPELVFDALTVVGAVALAAVGSGRLGQR